MPTIRVSDKTKKRLSFFGKFGMSYDDVINDAMDQLEDAIDKTLKETEDAEDEDEDEEEDDEDED